MSPAAPTPPQLPDVRTWPTFARLLRRFRPRAAATAGVLGLHVLRSAFDLATPVLLGLTVGSLEGREGSGGGLPADFTTLLVALCGAMACHAVLQWATAVGGARLGQDLENALRSELFAKVMRLRFRWHDENRSGKTISRSLRDMEKARHFFREAFFGYVEMVLVVVGVVTLSFVVHWGYGVAIGGVLLVTAVATTFAATRTGRLERAASDLYDRVTTVLQENVAGARVVRAFGREPEESEKFGGRLGGFSGSWRVLARYWTLYMPSISHFATLVVPAALLVGGFRVASGAAIGEVLAVILYARMARDRLRNMTRVVLLGQEAVASATRVFEVLDHPDVVVPPARTRPLPPDGGDLVVEDVWFGHPGGRPVLRGVSLHVEAGRSLGILGLTGSGKTSLVHLVPRFYDADRGRILLDGVDVREIDPDVLARAVGLVFQEPFLFSASVAENIAYGNPAATREQVVSCARLAAADEFVTALPQGYDTLVGERGVSLSGGQRQRLTIARALAMEPRVLIFDDATASVDAATEKELFRGIRAAARGRTTLVISQRVTSVRWCDRIAVLEAGRVAAIGTHAELLEANALYREMSAHQALSRSLS
jgi:ATP-binding cassette subfamily B protein